MPAEPKSIPSPRAVLSTLQIPHLQMRGNLQQLLHDHISNIHLPWRDSCLATKCLATVLRHPKIASNFSSTCFGRSSLRPTQSYRRHRQLKHPSRSSRSRSSLPKWFVSSLALCLSGGSVATIFAILGSLSFSLPQLLHHQGATVARC